MREISYKGKSYKSLTDLAIEMKTSPANLSYRLKKYGGIEIKKEKKILRLMELILILLLITI